MTLRKGPEDALALEFGERCMMLQALSTNDIRLKEHALRRQEGQCNEPVPCSLVETNVATMTTTELAKG